MELKFYVISEDNFIIVRVLVPTIARTSYVGDRLVRPLFLSPLSFLLPPASSKDLSASITGTTSEQRDHETVRPYYIEGIVRRLTKRQFEQERPKRKDEREKGVLSCIESTSLSTERVTFSENVC